ncbi:MULTISPECIES: hypothetical protein [unclassified Streptomyces]|uniref:hypothetical protein n=1 Tax=unclassified Streptomyces TaxID=2593676 RepID=UPI00093B17C3|nr:hypothetical protein [Streptomyces sp. CB02058]OKI93708.1 hypothetical protein AMK10_14980 [Streptomyces sp. CB02058]
MYDERLAGFSRERLDGRPVPDDLRLLLVAQWEGRTEFAHLLNLEFFEAGEVHPLLDTSYLSEEERADPEMQAVNAGAAEMARHVKLVAKGGKGWVGYWLHPDEPADRAWHLIELDTEFTFWSMAGLTLTEGTAAERAGYQDEPDERIAFTRLATELAALGLPLSTEDFDALDDTEYTVDPEKLMEGLIEAEREKRGLR